MAVWLDDLRMRLQLSQGSATLVLVIAQHDTILDETRRILIQLLRVTPLTVTDLGVGSHEAGPRRWAELTRSQPEGVYVITAAPATPLSLAPMVRLYNAQRELLRELKGPVVLLVSSATEEAIRQQAPDFFTWVAQSYALPSPGDLAAIAKQAGVASEIVAPPVLDEEPVRFLHISDIHLRPQIVKRYDQDRVLRGLIAFLERDRPSFPLDLIFVTGDLANTGKADEYVLVVDLLKKLMEVTGVPPEHMFVVPGNHDVDRDVGRWLLRTLSKDEESIAFFEDAKSRAFHLKKLDAYAESMRAVFGEERPLGLAVGEDAVEILEVRGARLAVASFNSAWFAQGDDDRGKLWLGDPNVDRAGQRVADLEAPFAVALMHHPFGELHDIERDNVERYVERSFDMVVRGHLHKDKTQSIATQRGGYVEVAGAAAYQGSQWPNGCFLGEIRTKARKVRLRPYAYASGPDGWVLDTKVFPDDEGDGYCRTFAVVEKRRVKGAMTRHLEEAVEAAVKTASPAQQRKIAEELGVDKTGEASLADVVGQTAKVASALVLDPLLWERVLGDGSLGRALAHASVGLMRDGDGSPARVPRTNPRFLEIALMRATRAFLRVVHDAGIDRGLLLEDACTEVLSVALQAIVEGPISRSPKLPGGGRPDVLIGARDDPSAQLAVIEVKRLPKPGARDWLTREGLRQLDRYLATSGAVHGALVLFNALAPTETEPQLEHLRTPAGRDVLLLRL